MTNWIGILILVAINLIGIGVAYGKLSEQIKNNSNEIKELFLKLEAHTEDEDLHWGKREREWQDKRFKNLETKVKPYIGS